MSRRAWYGLGGAGVLGAIAACAFWSCNKDHGAEPGQKTEAQPPEKAPTKTIDPATVGTISGTVLFDKTLPPPTMIRANADAACAKAHPDDFDAGDLMVKDGKVENAFVWVKSGLEEYRFDPPPAEPVKIEQQGCMYKPRVFGARTNQPMEFINDDPTLHNINAKPTRSSGFNFVTPQGAKQARAIKKAEVMVRVGCDVHPWMRSFAGVLDHPFFRVTGADGRFELAGLPPGTFTLGAWHERLGETEMAVTIAAKEAKAVDLKLPGPK